MHLLICSTFWWPRPLLREIKAYQRMDEVGYFCQEGMKLLATPMVGSVTETTHSFGGDHGHQGNSDPSSSWLPVILDVPTPWTPLGATRRDIARSPEELWRFGIFLAGRIVGCRAPYVCYPVSLHESLVSNKSPVNDGQGMVGASMITQLIHTFFWLLKNQKKSGWLIVVDSHGYWWIVMVVSPRLLGGSLLLSMTLGQPRPRCWLHLPLGTGDLLWWSRRGRLHHLTGDLEWRIAWEATCREDAEKLIEFN